MNFFYSISINDRIKFPILDSKQDPAPPSPSPSPSLPSSSSLNYDSLSVDMDFNKDSNSSFNSSFGNNSSFSTSKISDEDHYFGAFKHSNHEKGLYCDEILKYLDGFFQKQRNNGDNDTNNKQWKSIQHFLDSFSSYVHSHSKETRELMDTMNTKKLITPYIELSLPVHILEEYNQLEQDDPRINLYQLNPVWGPAIKEFGFFWERYESNKEVLCMFVWSTVDHTVVPMPAVGLNPYPLCWVCDKGFGTIACSKCKVAKYCSKECCQQDWIRHGGPVCDLMAAALRRVKQLTFKRPPSPTPPIPTAVPPDDNHHRHNTPRYMSDLSSNSTISPSSSSPTSASNSVVSSSSPFPSPPRSPSMMNSISPSPSPDLDLDADPPFGITEYI